MKQNSNTSYILLHPEYFVDLIRTGGRISKRSVFKIPPKNSDLNDIKYFVDEIFPGLSIDKDEIWLNINIDSDPQNKWITIDNINSAHFYNEFRLQNASKGVLHTLNVYGIPVLEPIESKFNHIFEEYDAALRTHVARFIVSAWFKDIVLSDEFINQVKIGSIYQQAPNPDKLTPLDSNLIWAQLVSYNPGLRKFDERPDVLWLQDIQEVIKRTDAELKDKLKKIGEKYNSKFLDIIDDAEASKKRKELASEWIVRKLAIEDTYFKELDRFLSELGCQKSFFYSALLYLQWREKVLNADYKGSLADNNIINKFLNDKNNLMHQPVAEALFTIIYAGGPRVFQRAMIEAKFKISNQVQPKVIKEEPEIESPKHVKTNKVTNFIVEFGKKLIDFFDKLDDSKKKEVELELKKIKLNKNKIKSGSFEYEDYLTLCKKISLIPVSIEDFNTVKLIDSFIDFESKLNEVNNHKNIEPINFENTSNEFINTDIRNSETLIDESLNKESLAPKVESTEEVNKESVHADKENIVADNTKVPVLDVVSTELPKKDDANLESENTDFASPEAVSTEAVSTEAVSTEEENIDLASPESVNTESVNQEIVSSIGVNTETANLDIEPEKTGDIKHETLDLVTDHVDVLQKSNKKTKSTKTTGKPANERKPKADRKPKAESKPKTKIDNKKNSENGSQSTIEFNN